MDLYDFYYRQIVTQSEMDWVFAAAEQADHNISVDDLMTGIVDGLDVSENGAGADLSVDITSGVAYTSDGARVAESEALTNLDCSVDEYGVSTDVATPGNERWLTVFARFTRLLQEPKIDGSGLQVYTKQLEDCELIVHQGAEAVIGVATRPALIDGAVLLADINLVYGQTTIQTATHIFENRRQDWMRLTGTTLADFIHGNAHDAIEALWNILDGWAGIGSPFSFTSTWYGSLAVAGPSAPIESVAEALNAIVYDLALSSATPGAIRVGIDAYTAPNSHVSWPLGSVRSALRKVSNDTDTFIENFESGVDDKILALAMSNWKELINSVAEEVYDIIYYQNIEKWVMVMYDEVYVCPIGVEINAASSHTLGAYEVGHQSCTAQYYNSSLMICENNGDIEYCSDPDGGWTTVAAATIGGSGQGMAIATKFPLNGNFFTMYSRWTSGIHIAASGIAGAWTTPTTPPSISNMVMLLWLGNGVSDSQNWIAANSSGAVSISFDNGDNWEDPATTPASIFDTAEQVAMNRDTGTVIMVGDNGSGQPRIARGNISDWLDTWTEIVPSYPDSIESDMLRLQDVVWVGGDVWIAVGTSSSDDAYNVIVSKDDGLTWNWVLVSRTNDASSLRCIAANGTNGDGTIVIAAGTDTGNVRAIRSNNSI